MASRCFCLALNLGGDHGFAGAVAAARVAGAVLVVVGRDEILRVVADSTGEAGGASLSAPKANQTPSATTSATPAGRKART